MVNDLLYALLVYSQKKLYPDIFSYLLLGNKYSSIGAFTSQYLGNIIFPNS